MCSTIDFIKFIYIKKKQKNIYIMYRWNFLMNI